jgi:hypothetical protein
MLPKTITPADVIMLTPENMPDLLDKEGTTIEFALVHWSPEVSQIVLETRNTQNRRVSPAQIKMLSRCMENEEFFLTNQGIAIGEDGQLVDGQTRLAAIVNSGCGQMLLTAINVPRAAYTAIDQGRKKHIGDALKHFLGDSLEVGLRAKMRGVVNNFLDQINHVKSSELSLNHRVNTYLYYRESFDFVMNELYDKNLKTPKLANTSFLAAFVRGHASGLDPQMLRELYDCLINNHGIVVDSKMVGRLRDYHLGLNTAPSKNKDRKTSMNEMEYVIAAYVSDPEGLKDRFLIPKKARNNPTFELDLPEEVINGEFQENTHVHSIHTIYN